MKIRFLKKLSQTIRAITMPKRKKRSEKKVRDKKEVKKIKDERLQIRFEGAATAYTLFRIET
jgi:hypothetical protein